MIPRRTFILLLLSTAVRSENPEGSLRLNVPLWDVGDLYSRISNAFGAASSTPAPQAAAPWTDYYNALLQEYYKKKQGLSSANEAVAVEPLPLPIPVPVPLPRPPRPLPPLRPLPPNRPWPKPTKKPTRRSTTTTTTSTTASPISSSSSSSTSTPSVITTTEAVNITTIPPTTNSTTEESSTPGALLATGFFPSGSSTTGISVSNYIRNKQKLYPQATTAKPFFSHAPISSPTVLSLEGSSPGGIRPEQKLKVQSPPQSMTSLCHNYPRLCAQPEEAQYIRLKDGFGKPMLLILPGSVDTLPQPIVSPISTIPRPYRSRPYRRRKPSRSRYIYRVVKKRNNRLP